MKRFLGAFTLALGLFTIIIIVFDLSEKIDEFVEHKLGLGTIIFDFYIYWIPTLLNMFSPVFVFISVIFFTSKMAQNSEIIAILSSGVSYFRFLRPYVAIAILLGAFSFVLSAWIIPKADKKRVVFEDKYIRNRSSDHVRELRTQIKPGEIMSMGVYNYMDSTGMNISLEHIEDGQLKSKLKAYRLTWNDSTDSWQVLNYWIRIYHKDSQQIIKGAQMDTMIDFNPEDFFRRQDDVQSFNMAELDKFVEFEKMRGTGNYFFYFTEKHKRYAAPFAIIILTVIGASVSSRKSRGGIGLNLGVGLLLSFTFLVVMQFFTAHGSSGNIYAPIAVWMPNIIFTGVAYLLYLKAQK